MIAGFQGKYRFLSNFWPAPLIWGGIRYPTSEHAYQASKTKSRAERWYIAGLPTPGMAKRAGKRITLRKDWESIKLDTMSEIVFEKFTQNPYLAKLLRDTKDEELVEVNTWGDTFWGVCNGTGHNHLGKILMAVREKL